MNNKFNKTIIEIIGSFCYIGYLKISGTFATLATLPLAAALIYLNQKFSNLLLPAAALLTTIIAIPVSTYLENLYREKDPHRVVIDEVAGYLVTILFFNLPLINESSNTNFYILFFTASFLLFRFFDIVKVWPANISQNLPRGWGIVIDDIIAGIYANIALRIILYFV